MSIDELMGIFFAEAELKTCVICGTPFKPYSSRQKTCGSKECQRQYKRLYQKEWQQRYKEADPAAYAKYHRDAMRKYRQKVKDLKEKDIQLQQIQEHWDESVKFDRGIDVHADDYGEYQKQRTLAMIPKIDVNLGGKDDTVCSEDEP